MQPQGMEQAAMTSDKDWTTLLLLSLFLGGLGADHFYTGKTVTGILKLITLGGCTIWALIDLIMVITGGFKDSNGLPVTNK
ncbi:MAG: TM2 domain-containing protein [Euryarchaeota archaeon]|jgi:TM2 domain-containing membrane protein YozV|nr:TM2 domain-containing protein [Euryarchaeota archaeon]MDA9828234.1 TM2 domain-containing protein [Candidatus Poseidoniaceae archaeon]MDC3236202.1 TM2 domain-containing protein [Candidatus Poseidoniaceae archaeon]